MNELVNKMRWLVCRDQHDIVDDDAAEEFINKLNNIDLIELMERARPLRWREDKQTYMMSV